ncbi:MAG: ArnT family glycosyltransferase [Pirellulaceae bacterium]
MKSVYCLACNPKCALAVILVVQSVALSICIVRYSPVNDEFGHFYAGLCYWRFADTRTFNVNSPLIRSLGTLPAAISDIEVTPVEQPRLHREEFGLGRKLFRKSPNEFRIQLALGRFLVASFAVSTTFALFSWGSKLAGEEAGLVAAFLWAFQPQTVAHGCLITTDIATCCLMLVAVWFLTTSTFGRYRDFSFLGILLAAAILAKFTAILILLLLPFRFLEIRCQGKSAVFKLIACGAFTIAFLVVLAAPYGFVGVGWKIVDYQFNSQAFKAVSSVLKSASNSLPFDTANRIPLPIAAELLYGMDRQQLDFERGLVSYAAGQISNKGWWWFYLYASVVKLPTGAILAIFTASMLLMFRPRKYGEGLGVPLLATALILLATAQQSGFAQQHRYILPAYPFIFICVGATCSRARQGKYRSLGNAILFFTFLSFSGFLVSAPNWLSAFNLYSGGVRSGFKCLYNDASDWGQDSYLISAWIRDHQGTRPIYVQSHTSGHEELRALDSAEFLDFPGSVSRLEHPCWLVVSKSDYVSDPLLSSELDNLQVSQFLGGTHLIYCLDASQPRN